MGRQSRRIADGMRREAADIIKFITLLIDRKLRRNPSRGGTPVDTGHARANWVPSVGEPFRGNVEGVAPSEHDRGVIAVLGYKLGDGPAWVTNNVPYILFLNDGSSAQSPAGFIERAIAEAVQEARDKFGNVNVSAGTTGSLGAEMAGNVASAYNPLGGDDD